MRVIEKQMVAAVEEGRNWRSGNTRVRFDPVVGGSETEVYLFGNLIAKRYFIGSPEHYIGDWEITLAGYNTRTTRSRLGALLVHLSKGKNWPDGAGVGTKNSVISLHDARGKTRINSDDWYKVQVHR